MKSRTLHNVLSLIGLLLFVVAFVLLRHELRQHNYRDVLRHLAALPLPTLMLAALFTAASYTLLSLYDLLALRYIKQPLSYGRTMLTSFIIYVYSNHIGLSVLGGAAVRYRLYSLWGLTALDISKVVVFCTLTFWLGFLALAGVLFLWAPFPVPERLHLPFSTVRPLGVLLVITVTAYLLAVLWRRAPVRFRQWEFELPTRGMSAAQILVSALDLLCSGTVLYVLLRELPGIGFPEFMGI